MKERLRSLIGPMADDVTMGTFHAVCTRMLRAEADHVGLDRRFIIYDDDDQMEVIKRCLITLEVDTKRFSPRSVLSSISQAKSQLLEPRTIAVRATSRRWCGEPTRSISTRLPRPKP